MFGAASGGGGGGSRWRAAASLPRGCNRPREAEGGLGAPCAPQARVAGRSGRGAAAPSVAAPSRRAHQDAWSLSRTSGRRGASGAARKRGAAVQGRLGAGLRVGAVGIWMRCRMRVHKACALEQRARHKLLRWLSMLQQGRPSPEGAKGGAWSGLALSCSDNYSIRAALPPLPLCLDCCTRDGQQPAQDQAGGAVHLQGKLRSNARGPPAPVWPPPAAAAKPAAGRRRTRSAERRLAPPPLLTAGRPVLLCLGSQCSQWRAAAAAQGAASCWASAGPCGSSAAAAVARLSWRGACKPPALTCPPLQKLTEEEAAAQERQLKHTERGASAWNAGGCWAGCWVAGGAPACRPTRPLAALPRPRRLPLLCPVQPALSRSAALRWAGSRSSWASCWGRCSTATAARRWRWAR